ncbi:Putative uncharacterized transposon-derived protein F52C9.6 [Eumeta japonica]|uniref:Uncharacterized transposon-derived protein F52C9.6 n=1 Tax=Eumeta variegata TaxID=151549 RepID=A0A4C1TTR7_EUMVA|nr:Putative uncharacterized transposon-derived protein F52C9.6 [Eumeta japonica]
MPKIYEISPWKSRERLVTSARKIYEQLRYREQNQNQDLDETKSRTRKRVGVTIDTAPSVDLKYVIMHYMATMRMIIFTVFTTGLSERVALLRINVNTLELSIIQVNAPTEASSDEELEFFYSTVDKAIQLSDNNIIIMGDFNAKIGQTNPNEPATGYGYRNCRGKRLIEFTHENNFAFMNTFFKKIINKDGLGDLLMLNSYSISLLENWRDEDTVNNHYDDFTNAIDASLKKAYDVSSSTNPVKNQALSARTKALIYRRQELQKTKPKSRAMKNELKALYKFISKLINLDYKAYRVRIIEKHLNTTSSVKKAYKELRKHKSWIEELKNKTKNTQNRTEIMKLATNFYKKLYSVPNQYTYGLLDINRIEAKAITDESEVIKGIKSLKTEKSPGPDGITNEVIKTGCEHLAKPLTLLFNQTLNSSHTPRLWSESDITLLYKKGDPNNIGVPLDYIKVIKNIYDNSTSRVKLETTGLPIQISKGVRQRDLLSPTIFIAVPETIIGKVNWEKVGININGRYLSHLRFADDIILLSESTNQLQEMINTLHDESRKLGLEINLTKTNIMTNHTERPIYLENSFLTYVNAYIYLGKQISLNQENNELEVERRVNITWKKFWSLKEILKSDMTIRIKTKVMNTCLLPSLTYTWQTWKFTRIVKNILYPAKGVCMERSILKIKKTQKIRQADIRQKIKVIDALIHLQKLKWRWAGHVARLSDNRWTRKTMQWTGPLVQRRRERPNARWVDDIIKVAGTQWLRAAENREY